MFSRSALEKRIVLLAPIGRDAVLLASGLSALEVERTIAEDPKALLTKLSEGAGCAIVAEEALTPTVVEALRNWMAEQPTWSDFPLIVLTFTGTVTREGQRKADVFQSLGNVTLIERPVRPDTMRSSARSALRARARQYEIRSRQEALIQANADLEQFAHSASHDLREPLRSLSTYSELLARRYAQSLDGDGVEYLSIITGAARRMDNLLDDLLSYAHASSISESSLVPVPVRDVIDAVLENLAGSIRESGAVLNVGQMPEVRMRESHLAQIFQNLISNSLKYRTPDAEVKVCLSATNINSQWIFTIADNGIGIPAAYHEAVFGIFKRLHSNTVSGTGMGLAICKRIVEKYGGRIWVESEPGGGAKFRFSLPA